MAVFIEEATWAIIIFPTAKLVGFGMVQLVPLPPVLLEYSLYRIVIKHPP